jgi:hypothetical protein
LAAMLPKANAAAAMIINLRICLVSNHVRSGELARKK